MNPSRYLIPAWPAPHSIRAFSTLRTGGHSQAPYEGFNLSTLVADDAVAVANNRRLLHTELSLPREPAWIKQVHGARVVRVEGLSPSFPEADASWAMEPGLVCAVLTADCLPLLLCHRRGLQVAAIHAGWRGLAAGIIERTLEQLQPPAADWLAWLGPAIGPTAFEVGAEVRELFTQHDRQAQLAFQPIATNQWLADIYLLARQRLLRYGVTRIYGGEYCTWLDAAHFYSYRRDGSHTGRMASLIWMK